MPVVAHHKGVGDDILYGIFIFDIYDYKLWFYNIQQFVTTFAQVQLENIRQKDNEVRWQHEDDADKCNGCKNPLGSNKKKKVRLLKYLYVL